MTEGVPALATIALMVFTYNIANGLTAGLVLYLCSSCWLALARTELGKRGTWRRVFGILRVRGAALKGR